MNKSNLMRKDGKALINLAKYFLAFDIGDKVDTIVYYAKTFELSVGTVQKALKKLEEFGALNLKRKGHMGTYIETIDYAILIKIAGIESLVCVMPLPYSKRYEGLASGLKQEFKSFVPLYFAHMRGANTRIAYLKKGIYDFAIVSKLAAKEYLKKNKELTIALEFPKGSYVGGHGLIYRDKKVKTIGVDKSSLDQYFLTQSNFQNNENYNIVDVNYSETIEHIKSGQIDGAIWNIDILDKIKEAGLNYQKLANTSSNNWATQAVLLIHKDNKYLEHVLKKVFNVENIIRHQEKIINGELIPSY